MLKSVRVTSPRFVLAAVAALAVAGLGLTSLPFPGRQSPETTPRLINEAGRFQVGSCFFFQPYGESTPAVLRIIETTDLGYRVRYADGVGRPFRLVRTQVDTFALQAPCTSSAQAQPSVPVS
jgi:hypothetical protein